MQGKEKNRTKVDQICCYGMVRASLSAHNDAEEINCKKKTVLMENFFIGWFIDGDALDGLREWGPGG